MVRGVVPKFISRESFYPLFRFFVHNTPNIHFEALVSALSLVVCLRMARRVELQFGVHQAEEFLPEGASEDFISI